MVVSMMKKNEAGNREKRWGKVCFCVCTCAGLERLLYKDCSGVCFIMKCLVRPMALKFILIPLFGFMRIQLQLKFTSCLTLKIKIVFRVIHGIYSIEGGGGELFDVYKRKVSFKSFAQ